MKLKQLFDDDDAVSPVIGVILMVAITVILAAVIATFVLGLGEQVSQTTPTAQFSSEFTELNEGVGGIVSFTHNGGDTIKASAIYVRGRNGSGSGVTYNDPWENFTSSSDDLIVDNGLNPNRTSGSASASIDNEPAVAAGDFIQFPVGTEAELRLVYSSQQSQQTATLTEFQGPDA